MKQSIILGTTLAFALSVAPVFAGNFDALKTANGTSMSAAELASVEGMRRNRGGIRVGNSSYVKQKNSCKKCKGVRQNNSNYTSQSANLTIVKINVRVKIGGKGRPW